MDLIPLMKFISNQLLCDVGHYRTSGESIACCTATGKAYNDQMHHPAWLPQIIENTSEVPLLYLLNQQFCLFAFTVELDVYVIGPSRVDHFGQSQYIKHPLLIPDSVISPLNEFASVNIHYFVRYGVLLYNCCTGSSLSENECWKYNVASDEFAYATHSNTVSTVFSNRESGMMHNSYLQEQRLLNCVTKGDIRGLQLAWDQAESENLGTTAKDPIRNGKNIAIYIITACGRAAIRGGAPVEYVFSLTDAYTQQIEELQDMMVLQSIVETAQLQLTQLVADRNTSVQDARPFSNPIVEQCKKYVQTHLHDKLTVQIIASHLHIHPNYLNSQFKKYEHVSLYQYVLREKIEEAKQLLTFSEYSYSAIANYLGFASQSHLGEKFKDFTGMTLRQYRESTVRR